MLQKGEGPNSRPRTRFSLGPHTSIAKVPTHWTDTTTEPLFGYRLVLTSEHEFGTQDLVGDRVFLPW